ncbi:MAG: ATP-binding cassette domain-containing protein [Coriobacteriales bacterium]|jgi:ATPase subunit of ABC transporter with duplicated ATPase domains|nr:ATP-binding cassette domain-containing protein [Coriobacteriales bacterium]
MAVLINCKDVHLHYPVKRVLDGVTLGINSGDRIGVVGRNGDGKSSLLQVLGGGALPFTGEVTRRNNTTVGVLQQADGLKDADKVGLAVVGTLPKHEWAADRTIRAIIDALLGDVPWDAPVGGLSGGQRRRVDLARLLIGSWDVLMLDEPTNHLDLQAIAWLAAHLKARWPAGSGALLVVTHDRWFLDEVCEDMWEVHDGTVDSFEGGYSAYILQRVQRDAMARKAEQKRRNLARKELAWLSRGAQARSTKPKFRVQTARELIADEPPARNPLELKKTAMTRLGKQVVDLVDVRVSYDTSGMGSAGDTGTAILNGIDWILGPGDRIGILGDNGAGKTTLLKVITGRLAPSIGRVKIGASVRFGFLSQRLDELEVLAGDRVREVLAQYKTSYLVEGKSLSPAQLLERMGFARGHLNARVCDLSGGQKRRLQLLLTLLQEPNVLILDEPGNDMDTDMLAVMEDLLDSWPGTLVLVSHDRYLTERVTDDQMALLDGRLRHVPGGVDEYLQLLSANDTQQSKRRVTRQSEGQTVRQGTREGTRQGAQSQAQQKTGVSIPQPQGVETYQLRKQIASIERKLHTMQAKDAQLTVQMHEADPTGYEQLINLGEQQRELRQRIEQQEQEWLEATELLEEACP